METQQHFANIESLYNRSLFLQAWNEGKHLGDPWDWPGPEGQVWAGRLVRNLGGFRLARFLHLRAYRRWPENPQTAHFFIWALTERWGYLKAWDWLNRPKYPTPQSLEDQTEDALQRAYVLAHLRDFQRADAYLERAADLNPSVAWRHVVATAVLRLQDKFEQALKTCEDALAINPDQQSALGIYCALLQSMGEKERAETILHEKVFQLESCVLASQLLQLAQDREDWDGVQQAITRIEQLAVLKDPGFNDWLNFKRFELAIGQGNYQSATEAALSSGFRHQKKIAENIRRYVREHPNQPPKRRRLDVPFVQQHHKTCAPATLAAITRYWEQPSEHLEIADKICYDGTPAYSERRWANQNGFRTHEFTVTWDISVALIDRGIPFTLTTVGTNSAHLQAIIGYDEAKRTLLLMDPSSPGMVEINTIELFESQKAHGPRGMLLVPPAAEDRLEDLPLPDSEAHDHLFELNACLDRFDRSQAVAELDWFRAHLPEHQLTALAERIIGAFDQNTQTILDAVSRSLSRFPENTGLMITKLALLRDLGRREERLALLQDSYHREYADPNLLLEWAEELSTDDRELDFRTQLVKHSLRIQPDNPAAVHLYAQILWASNQRLESLEQYRLAACLGDMQEEYVRTYFAASQYLGKQEETLSHLKSRFERLGHKSSRPAISYSEALTQINRPDSALEVLQQAESRCTERGPLLLYTAKQLRRYGRTEEGKEKLDQAKPHIKETEWMAASASILASEGQTNQALDLWRGVLKTEPISLSAHLGIANLLAASDGPEAAQNHLETACREFPFHFQLHCLWLQYLNDEATERRAAVIDKLLEIDATIAWVHREKATVLFNQGEFRDAAQWAQSALDLDATSSASHTLRGQIFNGLAQPQQAEAALRQAIQRSADDSTAIYGLLAVTDHSLAAQKAALEFIESEMVRQTLFGEALLTYRVAARGILTPTELLQSLERAHQARPDLWQSGSALIHHLLDMEHWERALDVAQQAVEQFPLDPNSWMDLATVHQRTERLAPQIAALESALQIDPSNSTVIAALCQAVLRQGDGARVRQLLESASKRSPNDTTILEQLATHLQRTGESTEAVRVLEKLTALDIDHDWAWETLQEATLRLQDSDRALERAEQLVSDHPRESGYLIRLAKLQENRDQTGEALDTLDRALAINPYRVATLDQKAMWLAKLNRFDEAEQICREGPNKGAIPAALRFRLGWLHAVRGDRKAAIAELETLVQSIPNHGGAWHQLVEWYSAEGDHEAAIQAAERLSWLHPESAIPHGWIAGEKLEQDQPEEAIRHLEKAIRIQPDYEYGIMKLVDAYCEKADFESANRIAETYSIAGPPGQVAKLRTIILKAQNNGDEMLQELQILATSESSDMDGLPECARLFIETPWAKNALRLLREVIDTGTYHPSTPEAWASLYIGQGNLGNRRVYRWLHGLGDPGRKASYYLLYALAESEGQVNAGTMTGALRAFWIRTICRDWIDTDTVFWGWFSSILRAQEATKRVLRLMADWRERENVSGWMLDNYLWACCEEKRTKELEAGMRFALSRPDLIGEIANSIKLRFALGISLKDEVDTAQNLLRQMPIEQMEDDERDFYEFVILYVQVKRMELSGEPLNEIDTKPIQAVTLTTLMMHYPVMSPALRHLGRLTSRRTTQARGWFALIVGPVLRSYFEFATRVR